ncbi:TonB-dependent hemoglobin/transferrin/lactoferrin family receptor [Pseudoalteromonas denitrificans]|uniref:Hemoglobin/transferrin/lactoferrin receptor protein n=1 Tax=Pseudoalteromonas denitrificans DSM 6059 TaxID=1123010 RepID=A0A1I1PSR6_9GAMM|nr:TonB-dependent hemoglobin/transferrin/lactoferrin family receptor [Pseudoalteromonas denitrificans]SFD12722.1 hemoglobin/transferrin/lactoferrin receptor protein [Pseudoalteromonas denitrificans DSM 6059]
MFNPNPAVIALAVSAALFSAHNNAKEQKITDTLNDLETIVVSASRTEKLLKDVAGSISVITSDDIENQAVNDMSQLFKYDPSVQVTGDVGGAQNIVVRGMGSDRILMIKDGMRMNEGYGANGLNDIVGRGFIETDILKQVEVAKGAYSSLYGADALGGIVVFTTKDASDYLAEGETISGKLKAGYFDLSSQSSIAGTFALRNGDFEHLFNVSTRSGEEEQNYNETKSPFDIDSNSFFYKGKYNLNETDFISFTADIWQQESKGDSADGLLTYFRPLATFGYQIVDENAKSTKGVDSFQLRYQSATPTTWYDFLNVSIYHNETQQDDVEYSQLDINAPMFGVIEIRDMWKTGGYNQKTLGFISHASKEIYENHTLGFGLDIETTQSSRDVIEYREVAGDTTKDVTTQKFPKNDVLRTGIYINDEIKLIDNQLIVTAGMRFDKYEMDPNGALKSTGETFLKVDDQDTTFNLGALFHINDVLDIYSQYGQGFKVPAYDLAYVEHYNQPTSEYIYEVIPSEDLAPEKSDTYELGLRGRIENLAFTSAIFYNKFTDFLSTELMSHETVNNQDGSFSHIHDKFQYRNLKSVTIKGAEFGITYYANDYVSVFANAAYQDGKDNETDLYLSSINPLSGTLGVTFEVNNFSSDLVLNWAKRMTKVNEGQAQSPGYGSLDWLVNYQLTDEIKMNASINNVFDSEYARYSKINGHAVDTDISNIAEPGRHFAMSMSYQF